MQMVHLDCGCEDVWVCGCEDVRMCGCVGGCGYVRVCVRVCVRVHTMYVDGCVHNTYVGI